MMNVGKHTLVSIEVGNKLNKVDLMFWSYIVFYSELFLCVYVVCVDASLGHLDI